MKSKKVRVDGNYITTTTATVSSTNVIPSDSISRISVYGKDYDISLNEDAFAEAMKKYMDKFEPKFFKIECQSCGASINQKLNDHIMKCPYCHSVYAIGTKMINLK